MLLATLSLGNCEGIGSSVIGRKGGCARHQMHKPSLCLFTKHVPRIPSHSQLRPGLKPTLHFSLLNDLPLFHCYSLPYFQRQPLPSVFLEFLSQQYIGVFSTCHLLTISGKGKRTELKTEREPHSAEEILDSAVFWRKSMKIHFKNKANKKNLLFLKTSLWIVAQHRVWYLTQRRQFTDVQ